jgi:hypothetical protein
MTDQEVIQLIRRTIRQEMAAIMMSTVQSNADQFRTTVQRFATDSSVDNIRSIQPYGFASRATDGTGALLIPLSSDATNMAVAGHLDSNRPSLSDGETLLYDAYGHVVYLSEGKMQFGSKASANPMVLGDLLQTFLENFLQLFATHTHEGNLGYPTGAPDQASQAEEYKASPVGDGTFLSDKAFTEK